MSEDENDRVPIATVGDAQAVAMVVLAAKAIDPDSARRIVRHANQQETVLPIIDPTLYRSNAKAIEASRRVAQAFLAFRKVIDEETARPEFQTTPIHGESPIHDAP